MGCFQALIHIVEGTLVLRPAMSHVPQHCAVEVWVHPVAPPSCITGFHVAAIFQSHLLGGELCPSLDPCGGSACCLHFLPVPSLPRDGLTTSVCVPVVSLCYHMVAWANLSNAHRDMVLPCGSSDIHAACLSCISGARSQPGQSCSPAVPRGCQVTKTGLLANMPCPQSHYIFACTCLFIHAFFAWINMLQPVLIGCLSCCEQTP